MAAYVWPLTLPQTPQSDYSESAGLNILRTPMDAGPAKMRLRSRKPKNLTVSFHMSSTQVETLETFVYDTIKGVARFEFTHPRLLDTVEVRIVPQGSGDLFSIAYMLPDLWTISMTLEVMP